MTPLAAIGTFERFIKYWSKGEAFYFVVAESRSFLHVHALVGGVGDLIPFRIMKRWEYNYGSARIQRYDRGLGAAHYIVKDLGSDKFEWNFSLPNLKGGVNDDIEVRQGFNECSHALRLKEPLAMMFYFADREEADPIMSALDKAGGYEFPGSGTNEKGGESLIKIAKFYLEKVGR